MEELTEKQLLIIQNMVEEEMDKYSYGIPSDLFGIIRVIDELLKRKKND